MEDNLPTDIKLHKKSSILEIVFADKKSYKLTAEFLRVHSPSAEVRGHGKGQEVLQPGKRQVKLLNIEPVGNYAIQLSFDDGHNSGFYSWSYLYELCTEFDSLWDKYLAQLKAAGVSRDALPEGVRVVNIMPSPPD